MTDKSLKANNICIGLIAHVDGGKTTFSEALLSDCGFISKPGRVDHGDSFLDYFTEERERGLTIFSKPVIINIKDILPKDKLKNNPVKNQYFSDIDSESPNFSDIDSESSIFYPEFKSITLIDTPGHLELQAETERALAVMDYCIMIISGADSVTKEDRALWDLISSYGVPVFLFINKMDLPGANKRKVLDELREKFGEGFVDFSLFSLKNDFVKVKPLRRPDFLKYSSNFNKDQSDLSLKTKQEFKIFLEDIASLDEEIMEEYLKNGDIKNNSIASLISKRKLFPCQFGAALKNEGIYDFFDLILNTVKAPEYPLIPSAFCYKVAIDNKGKHIGSIKVTGGSIHPRDALSFLNPEGETESVKINQIFYQNGHILKQTDMALAGEIVILSGIDHCFAGSGLGGDIRKEKYKKIRQATIRSRIKTSDHLDSYSIYTKFSKLCEEFPEVEVSYSLKYDEINVLITGKLQAEILKTLMRNRYSINIDFLNDEEVESIDQKRLIEETEMMEEDIDSQNQISSISDEAREASKNIDPGNKKADSSLSKESSKKAKEDLLGEGLRKDAELMAIFNKAMGRNIKKKEGYQDKDQNILTRKMRKNPDNEKIFIEIPDPKEIFMLVDGYNIIFNWDELKALAGENLEDARLMLCDILADYQAYKGINLILVFDAYKVPGNPGSINRYHNMYVIFTKEAQTADAYIEKSVHLTRGKRRVIVVTNDNLEQTITFGSGALRMTAAELKEDVRLSSEDMYEKYLSRIHRLENRMVEKS